MQPIELRARRNAPFVTSRHGDRGVAFRLTAEHYDVIDAMAAENKVSTGTLARLVLQDVADNPGRYKEIVRRVVVKARAQEEARRQRQC